MVRRSWLRSANQYSIAANNINEPQPWIDYAHVLFNVKEFILFELIEKFISLMKIIRCVDRSGCTIHAEQCADGIVREITGDLLGAFQTSDRVVEVAKLLAPVQPTAIMCIGLKLS